MGGCAQSGAGAMLGALVQSGVSVCFANPGTTELDFVRAAQAHPEMRCIVGLQENVCTGAADGYGRMRGKPAATLLHLGPGFANGIANLHNARRARTPIVNLIGDHTSWHLPYDAPLSSDIESLAKPVSGWVHRVANAQDMAASAHQAVAQSRANGGQGATLIVPADFQAAQLPHAPQAVRLVEKAAPAVTRAHIQAVAARLRAARKPLFLLGGGGETAALSAAGQKLVARLCAALGAKAYAETFPSRAERGQGLPDFDRLPYFPEPARAVLDLADIVVLVGALRPITYFGYEGQPSQMVEDARLLTLAGPGEDAVAILEAVVEELGAAQYAASEAPVIAPQAGPLDARNASATLARMLPEGAIVSVEGGTCGYPFYAASAAARPHTALTNTGGAIGQGLPVAMGAAIACPDRRVVALLSDGSTQYTIQTLWSLAHENLRVTVLIVANHQYAVLRNELRRDGKALSPSATQMTALDHPRIDWVGLATSYGVGAVRVESAETLSDALERAFAVDGPMLIEMSM
ncbi:acetolactate synthase large subunit [Pusillimonas sp. TS35]|uniref:acetolactate synthase large subunit n=1 Tax=Paracandidimonas lactea TaxID=2895524 RepID=UPI00136C211F|nr:acetolactate synthase large subunit [Paracandidimonas lactea]MYN14430.1 acetolactate synthase large subunit [Pusillimonas sp. TS35]